MRYLRRRSTLFGKSPFAGRINFLGGRDAASVAPPNSAPANITPPTISGTATVGSTLTVTNNGSWSGWPPGAYTYQWRDDGVDIGGATSSTFVLTSSELGGAVDCNVTATNGSGSATADSNNIGPITAGSVGSPIGLLLALTKAA
jgi:hypothetical protein